MQYTFRLVLYLQERAAAFFPHDINEKHYMISVQAGNPKVARKMVEFLLNELTLYGAVGAEYAIEPVNFEEDEEA